MRLKFTNSKSENLKYVALAKKNKTKTKTKQKKLLKKSPICAIGLNSPKTGSKVRTQNPTKLQIN